MPNETLELSEHELYFLPPGTPATAPATRVEVEVDGAMRVFLARLEWQYQNNDNRDFYLIFYCPAEDEKVGLLFHGACIKARTEALTSEEMRTWMRKSIQTSYSQRFWCPADKDFGIKFQSFGSADIEWRRDERHPKSVSFRWRLPDGIADFKLWPRNEFLRFCQQLYADEKSELNFALDWGKKSDQDKDALAFGCENGDWQQLQQLFSCAQKLITHYYGIFPWPEQSASYWDFDRDWSNMSGSPEPCADAIAWANRWRAAICGVTNPSFWRNEPICVYRWRHHEPQRRKLLSVRCTMPTAHEVLEAQLELREFLRPHLPDYEIEALMRPEPSA